MSRWFQSSLRFPPLSLVTRLFGSGEDGRREAVLLPLQEARNQLGRARGGEEGEGGEGGGLEGGGGGGD